MSKEEQTQLRELREEQEAAGERGEALGWGPADVLSRSIYQTVAEKATNAGLGDMSTEDFQLLTGNGLSTGIKIKDTEHEDLTLFWELVENVREQIPTWHSNSVASEKTLDTLVDSAIEGKLKANKKK